MIIPNLNGGLGNQMFQIAAGFAASRQLHDTFAINYNLSRCGGQGNTAIKYKENLFLNIPTTMQIPECIFKENSFDYEPIIKYPVVLQGIDGYFQSELYFDKYREEIKNLFIFDINTRNKIDKKLLSLSGPILGIHVRGGDYKHYPDIYDINITQYYIEALKLYGQDKTIICVTDDISYAQHILPAGYQFIYSNCNEIEDLYILTKCDYLIMTNSTFSWWGTWLGNESRKIICPKKWFGNNGPKKHNLYDGEISKTWNQI